MDVVMFPVVVFGGVLAGWLAGFVMERGGYGLEVGHRPRLAAVRWGAGSSGPWGLSRGGLAVLAVVAFLGAALSIVVQRQIWPRPPKGATLTPRAGFVPTSLSRTTGDQHG